MPSTITKKNAQKVRELLNVPTTLEQRVDAYGKLQDEVAEIDEKIAKKTETLLVNRAALEDRMAELKDQVLEEATADLDPRNGTEVVGGQYVLEVGKRKMSRTIKEMKRVAELVGLDGFFKLCTFPLREVDNYLNPHQRAEVLEEKHEGSRSFKVRHR